MHLYENSILFIMSFLKMGGWQGRISCCLTTKKCTLIFKERVCSGIKQPNKKRLSLNLSLIVKTINNCYPASSMSVPTTDFTFSSLFIISRRVRFIVTLSTAFCTARQSERREQSIECVQILSTPAWSRQNVDSKSLPPRALSTCDTIISSGFLESLYPPVCPLELSINPPILSMRRSFATFACVSPSAVLISGIVNPSAGLTFAIRKRHLNPYSS